MKVLFITNMYPTNAKRYYGIHVKEQIDYFVKRFNADSSIYFINAADKGKLEYIRSIFGLYFFLKKNRFDIIHIHYGLAGLFLLFFKPKGKIYLTLHGSDILKEQGHYIQVAITKLILRKVHKAFVQNGAMALILQNTNVQYEVLPCGIDCDFFCNTAPLKHKGELKLLIFPSDPIRPEKNFSLFMSVLETLKHKMGLEVEYLCIKDLSREQVRDILSRADCLLMTSLSEGSPQIVKEALACNLSVVSVPVGDVEIVLKDIPGCFTSNSYKPDELAHLVNETFLLVNKAIRPVFLKKQIYDSESVTKRLVENYTIAESFSTRG